MRFKHVLGIGTAILLLGLYGLTAGGSAAQSDATTTVSGACRTTDAMMDVVLGAVAEEDAPSLTALGIAAAPLPANVAGNDAALDAELAPRQRVQLWSFYALAPNGDGTIAITLNSAADNDLRGRLFRGSEAVTTLAEAVIFVGDGTTQTFRITEPGYYTLAISRDTYLSLAEALPYTVRLRYTPGTALPLPREIDNINYFPAVIPVNTREDGLTLVDNLIPDTIDLETSDEAWIEGDVLFHAGAFQDGRREQTLSNNINRGFLQVIFPQQYRVRVGAWVDRMLYLNGDLLVLGENQRQSGQRRIVYFEDLDVRGSDQQADIQGLLRLLRDGTNAGYTLGVPLNPAEGQMLWDTISGIWFMDDCVGVQMNTGQRLLADLSRGDRGVVDLIDDLNRFEIALENPDRRLRIDWDTVASDESLDGVNAQIYISNDTMSFAMPAGRTLDLSERTIRITAWDDGAVRPDDGAIPVTVTLGAIQATDAVPVMQLDWTAIRSLQLDALRDGENKQRLTFTYRDPVGLRDGLTTSRDTGRIERVEVLDSVIRIISEPVDSDTNGLRAAANGDTADIVAVHHELLPASDSYIELVMYEGTPAFYGRALPGMAGYLPRGSNNLGGECSTLTTVTPELNCAPNGEINPANGNLWYAVTDFSAHSATLNLRLTRSYNSMATNIDGPFGYGWEAGLRVDYTVPFDPEGTGSRLVDLRNQTTLNDYPVALDLTYAPGGLLTFTTPSGSRHQFEETAAGVFEGISMPDWRIVRGTLMDGTPGYTLQQGDGLTYEFDRAGRLQGYGYPDHGRWVTITFTDTALRGPGFYDTPVTLTDAGGVRELALYFNENHHVERGVLRPVGTDEACTLTGNCEEILYAVDGKLEAVRYPDGEQAIYGYSTAGLNSNGAALCYHSDARAPQLAAAFYGYQSGNWPSLGVEPTLLPATRIHYAAVNQDNADCSAIPQDTIWRSLRWDGAADGRLLTATTTNEAGSSAEYVYAQDRGILNSRGITFVLEEHRSYGDEDTRYTTRYLWNPQNGQMETIQKRIGGRVAINSTGFEYGLPTGAASDRLMRVRNSESRSLLIGGLAGFDVAGRFDSERHVFLPERVTLSDLSSVTYRYEGSVNPLYPAEMIDENGQRTTLTWENGVLQQAIIEDVFGSGSRLITTYEYEGIGAALGLPATVTQRVNENDSRPQTFRYEWDALGRMTSMTAPEIGTYQMRYERVNGACTISAGDCQLLRVTVVDPTGAMQRTTYDSIGRVTDQEIIAGETTLRHTQSVYYGLDERPARAGLLRATVEWLDAAQPLSFEDGCPQTDAASVTCYDYTLNAFTGEKTMTITDAYRRDTTYRYDALGRVVAVNEPDGSVTTYSYRLPAQAGDVTLEIVALRDDARDTFMGDGLPDAETVYGFDRNRQLRTVRYTPSAGATLTWNFANQFVEGANGLRTYSLNSLETLNSAGAGWRRTLVWDGLDGRGIPAEIELVNGGVRDLRSGAGLVAVDRSETIDSSGRVTAVRTGSDDDSQTTLLLVCARPGSLVQVTNLRDPSQSLSCNTSEDAALVSAAWYDLHDRLVCEYDPDLGTRLIQYDLTAEAYHQRVVSAYYEAEDCASLLLDGDEATPTATELQVFNAAGDLVSHTDVNGSVTTYNHDRRGRLIAIADDTMSGAHTFQYNGADLLTGERQPDGTIIEYQYNAIGQLSLRQVLSDNLPEDSEGLIAIRTTTYIYDQRGRLSEVITPDGQRSTFSYTAADNQRILLVTDPARGEHRYTWDDDTLTLTYRDPRGNETRYNYDTLGILWQIIDAAGRHHELTYDSVGLPVAWRQAQTDNGAGLVMDVAWDDASQTLALLPQDVTWKLALDLTTTGQIDRLQIGDSPTNVLAARYDAAGRLTDLEYANGSWSLERGGQQALRYTATTAGMTTGATVGFDSQYRMTLYQQDGSPAPLLYRYQIEDDQTIIEIDTPQGLRYLRTQPHRAPALMTLGTSPDSASNVTGQYLDYAFDQLGRIQEISSVTRLDNENGERWRSSSRIVYNENGLPISIIDAGQAIETFSYDLAGNLETYQNPMSNTYRYQYDALNRLVQLVTPTGSAFSLQYDELDRVTGICQSRQELNGGDRLYERCLEQGIELERYVYDPLGRLIRQGFDVMERDVEGAWLMRESALVFSYSNPFDTGALRAWGLAGIDVDDIDDQPFDAIVPSDLRVTLGYDNTLLNRLNTINVRRAGGLQDVTTLRYTPVGQLAQMQGGNGAASTYEYDAFGAFTGYQATLADGNELRFDYHYARDEAGWDEARFTLPSGQAVTVLLDDAGRIRQMDFPAGEPDRPLLEFVSVLNENDPSLLNVTFPWRSDYEITSSLQLDRSGRVNFSGLTPLQPRSIFLQLAYQRNALGAVQQEQILAIPRLLATSSTETSEPTEIYLLTLNYNRAQQPTTLRLTNRIGQPIYTLIYNYDATGRIQRETRRFIDGRQQVIEYDYGEDGQSPQLLGTETQFVEARSAGLPVNLSAAGLLGIALAAVVLRRRPRWLAVTVTAVGLIWLPLVIGQGRLVTVDLRYDRAGNLSEANSRGADGECRAAYTYDAANRLIRVDLSDGTEQIRRNYTYDGFNRLVEIENERGETITLLYMGGQAQPFAVQDTSGTMRYVNRMSNGAILFEFDGNSDDVTPIIFDGDGDVLQRYTDDTGQIWLFDPQRRLIPLNTGEVDTLFTGNGCIRLRLGANGLPADSIWYLIDSSSVWDPVANLYFADGRAYNPAINRTLQRTATGPRFHGDSYTFLQHEITIPRQRSITPYLNGLAQLDAAQDNLTVVDGLTSQAVLARYLPQTPGRSTSTFATAWSALAWQQQTVLRDQLQFPQWMKQTYNATGSRVDARTGALQVPDHQRPGQSGWTLAADGARRWFDHRYGGQPDALSPFMMLDGLLMRADSAFTPPATYLAGAWRPDTHIALIATQPAAPYATRTPDDVLDWLLIPGVENPAAALHFVEQLQAMPERTIEDRVWEALAASLPVPPELPPATMDDLAQQWFVDDVFGVADDLARQAITADDIQPPAYGFGANIDWLMPVEPPFVRD